ncbi:fimbria/pilus outer membrane usher protein [Salmonella enterica subsp. enterica]|nr:fimbria/pilus outer membrane usher protein [Salmonella enterica subsp. enterica]
MGIITPLPAHFAGRKLRGGHQRLNKLYGGAIGESNYQAVALGSGRILAWWARWRSTLRTPSPMPQDDGFDGEKTLHGYSYRISYSRDTMKSTAD